MTLAALRTPEERFDDLPGWAYPPRYLDDLPGYVGLRLHYIDEGPPNAEHTYLCLHGQPSWAYVYRKMAPVFLAGGGRVVAPDLFGFGRSDKPIDDAVYTPQFHRNALIAFIERMRFGPVTLVIQDWGGILGLTLPLGLPAFPARLVIMNTAFGDGRAPSEGFLAWRAFAGRSPDLDVAALMKRSSPPLSDAEAAAYAAPFPDQRFKAGVRRFPELVPLHPDLPFADLSRQAQAWWRERWTGPTFAAVGGADPVLGPDVMRATLAHIRGAPEPLLIHDGGHFLQEWGEVVARAAVSALTSR